VLLKKTGGIEALPERRIQLPESFELQGDAPSMAVVLNRRGICPRNGRRRRVNLLPRGAGGQERRNQEWGEHGS
jgi:hypothetical protein